MIAVLERAGYDAVAVGPEETKFGAVETRAEAARCAELFRKHREAIDGVIVTLPNFGDERAIADTLRMAELNVPVLMQATPDTPGKHDHQRPPRQLLRQDVGLQQPDAVRHSVLADHAAHRSAGFGVLREGPGVVRGGLPRGARAAAVADRRDWRAAGGVQHGALQRKAAGGERHLGRADRPFRNPGPHRAHERRRRRAQAKAGGDPASTSPPSGVPRRR